MLLVVGKSATDADWVEMPGLRAVMIWGAIAGLLLAKVRAPALLLHLVGFAIGFVVVVWQISSLIEGLPLSEQVQELWRRLDVWYEAATTGGISTDLLPFSLMLVTTAWLLGYLSSWFIFRNNNVWVGVVLAGIAIITNVSFLPDKYLLSFFIFTFFAMLLVVRMSIIQRHEAWRKARVEFNPINSWQTIHSAVWFSVMVMVLAALIPLTVFTVDSLKSTWKAGREPVERLEDHFERLFAGIPSRTGIVGRLFGRTLPFLSKVSLSEDVVFWAETDYPSYWVTQTYSEYTPQGWIAGKTMALAMGPDTLVPPRTDSLKRVQVEQSLQLDFRTSDSLSGGNLDWISNRSIVETLVPKQFEIDLADSSKDGLLPEDLQQLAGELRAELDSPTDEFIESYISRILPEDLVLMSVTQVITTENRPAPQVVILARKEPVAPEIVSWKFADTVEANVPYSMLTSVSLATDDDLSQAATDYSGFIRDHYLQLPPGLPERVRALAENLTADADTPLAKARAIEAYLRGPDFEYSEKIALPPHTSDGVDYFLFETKTGYSDYFGSSMAVMLRAVGVPTRMAAGYGPGEYYSEYGRRAVREDDSHGWVQVYFPKYGWIDFEPTPKWKVHGLDAFSESDLESDIDISEELLSRQFLPAPIDPREEDIIELSGESGAGGSSYDLGGLLKPMAIALGAIGSLWLVSYIIWSGSLANATPVERAYTKMGRLGALAGIRRRANQTPGEYAAAIAGVIPAVASDTRGIAWAFASNRYGRRELDSEDYEGVNRAWKSIRGSLVTRAFSRLVPVGRRSRR